MQAILWYSWTVQLKRTNAQLQHRKRSSTSQGLKAPNDAEQSILSLLVQSVMVRQHLLSPKPQSTSCYAELSSQFKPPTTEYRS
jgi:hypothetical protein